MCKYFHDTTAVAEFSADKMKKVNLYESNRMFCDVYCLEPGQQQVEHSHVDSDKIYHVLTGVCHVRVGDEAQCLSAGQVAIAPAGIVHSVQAEVGERATILVVMAPHPATAAV